MRSYLRRVNYYETDKMGVVHHSNYIRYFEEARTSFMDQVGYPYRRLEEENIVSPVTGITVKYKKPVRYGDTVEIRTYLRSMTKVRCEFSYEVVDAGTGEIRAEGRSQHCYLDSEGRIVAIHKRNPEFFSAFLAEVEPDDVKM